MIYYRKAGTTIPTGFVEEEWNTAMRFCDLLERYLGQGFNMDEAQIKAKRTMVAPNETREEV